MALTWTSWARSGPGSVVGIATGYGLDGPGIESRWGLDFPHLSRPALGPTQLLVQWIESFPEAKSGRGVTLTPHPLLVPWSWKSRAITLLPLWAIRPVESLSACTRVTFIFTFLLIFQVRQLICIQPESTQWILNWCTSYCTFSQLLSIRRSFDFNCTNSKQEIKKGNCIPMVAPTSQIQKTFNVFE